MYKQNPKQESSNLCDCVPQKGPCPNNCNQCFYNRPGAFYSGFEPNVPTLEEVGDKIVRMNCGHDSNIQKDLVIETAKKYKHFFFNTSIPNFDFPGPVVFTANPKEEDCVLKPSSMDWPPEQNKYLDNLMFVRLRVSTSNLDHVAKAILQYTAMKIPIVLTFMAYYEEDKLPEVGPFCAFKCYEYKVRHINSYWCPTKEFTAYVMKRMKKIGGRLVSLCGTLDSNWCRDCRNCETYYWQTLKHLKEIQI